MRGFGYFLVGSGVVFSLAGWLKVTETGHPSYTSTSIGTILTLAGAVVLVRHWQRERR